MAEQQQQAPRQPKGWSYRNLGGVYAWINNRTGARWTKPGFPPDDNGIGGAATSERPEGPPTPGQGDPRRDGIDLRSNTISIGGVTYPLPPGTADGVARGDPTSQAAIDAIVNNIRSGGGGGSSYGGSGGSSGRTSGGGGGGGGRTTTGGGGGSGGSISSGSGSYGSGGGNRNLRDVDNFGNQYNVTPNNGGFTNTNGTGAGGVNGEMTAEQRRNLMAVYDDLEKKWAEAKAANEGRYNQMLATADTFGQQATNRINQQGTNTAARVDNSMISRGLANSTIRDNAARAVQRDTNDQLLGVEQAKNQMKLGIMQDRTDAYPDYSLYANLLQMPGGLDYLAAKRTGSTAGTGGATNIPAVPATSPTGSSPMTMPNAGSFALDWEKAWGGGKSKAPGVNIGTFGAPWQRRGG